MNKKYAVMIEGKNIYMNRGQVARMGFFTTRWIEAENPHEAEMIALRHVKTELEKFNVLCNTPDDPPDILIERIKEVSSFGENFVPGSGFTFYEDELSKQ